MVRTLLPAAVFLALLSGSTALADSGGGGGGASPPNSGGAVPGDDIFGYTSGSDPGNVGDKQYFNENDARVGKRGGSYGVLDSKFAFGDTFAENSWASIGIFTAMTNSAGVPGLPDLQRVNFDGLALEGERRVIERSALNPFAVSLDGEFDINLTDPVAGQWATVFAATAKVFIDAPVIPDKLYWAANLEYSAVGEQAPGLGGAWAPSSLGLVSSALTWQVSPSFFFGAEARYFSLSDNATLSHEVDRALYVGPTALWKPNDKVALNVTVQPQVYGHSAASSSEALDLDNFERAQFRVKLVAAF